MIEIIFLLLPFILQGLGAGLIFAIVVNLLRPFANYALARGTKDEKPFNYREALGDRDGRAFIITAGFCAGSSIGILPVLDADIPIWLMYCFSALFLVTVWGWVMIGYVFVLMPSLFLIVILCSRFAPISEVLEKRVPLPKGQSWNAIFAMVIILIGLAYFIL